MFSRTFRLVEGARDTYAIIVLNTNKYLYSKVLPKPNKNCSLASDKVGYICTVFIKGKLAHPYT